MLGWLISCNTYNQMSKEVAGADLLWEKSTTGWLVAGADLVWAKNIIGWLVDKPDEQSCVNHFELTTFDWPNKLDSWPYFLGRQFPNLMALYKIKNVPNIIQFDILIKRLTKSTSTYIMVSRQLRNYSEQACFIDLFVPNDHTDLPRFYCSPRYHLKV